MPCTCTPSLHTCVGFPSLSQAARLLLSPPQNYFHSVPKWQLGTEADSRTLRPLVHLSILYLGYQNSLYLQSILCSLVHQVLYSRVSMLLASLFSVRHELYLVYACVKHVQNLEKTVKRKRDELEDFELCEWGNPFIPKCKVVWYGLFHFPNEADQDMFVLQQQKVYNDAFLLQ